MEDPIFEEVAHVASDAFQKAPPTLRWQTVAHAVIDKLRAAGWLSAADVERLREACGPDATAPKEPA
jgi:hypothetical protein